MIKMKGVMSVESAREEREKILSRRKLCARGPKYSPLPVLPARSRGSAGGVGCSGSGGQMGSEALAEVVEAADATRVGAGRARG